MYCIYKYIHRQMREHRNSQQLNITLFLMATHDTHARFINYNVTINHSRYMYHRYDCDYRLQVQVNILSVENLLLSHLIRQFKSVNVHVHVYSQQGKGTGTRTLECNHHHWQSG